MAKSLFHLPFNSFFLLSALLYCSSDDSLDWKDYGVQSIIDRTALNPELSNGSIILMHNGAKYTKDALETVISTLQSKGYEFVTLSELVYKDHFHMDPSGKQIPD